MRDEKILVGDKYQHFKGDIMIVLHIAKHSETLEEMVIYEHKNELWARPISSFLSDEDVSHRPDNVTGQKYRFMKIRKED